MGMISPAIAQESWPATSDWVYLIDADWDPTADADDQQSDYLDIMADVNGHDAYFYASSTSLFFRMGLQGTAVQGSGLKSFSWHVILDADNDNVPDWDVVVVGTGSDQLFTQYNGAAADAVDPAIDHPSFNIVGPLGSYVSETAAGYGSYTGFVYLDIQVPYTALNDGGVYPDITFDTPIAISMATAPSESITNSGDFVGNTSTVSGALANSATLGGDTFGFIYDTRDGSPYSTAGTWYGAETITVTGYGWPTSTSTYFNSGNLNSIVLDASSDTAWSGNITTNSAGELSTTNSWTIGVGVASGTYTFKIENPAVSSEWNTYDSFTVVDSAAPTVSSLSPVDNSGGISVGSNLVITFNEIVDVETGNITIKTTSGDNIFETIDVTGGLVTGTGTTAITINPTSDLSSATEYYVLIAATAFDDPSSNDYAGISSTTAWSFTTADAVDPTVSTFSPTDDATGISVSSNLVITFDEAVDVESGNITIKETSGDGVIETIDVTGGLVTGTGTTTITINPTSDLSGGTEYYVLIDATAFDDPSSNSYAGISLTTDWSFTTVADNTVPTITGTTVATDNSTIAVTFSEAVYNATGGSGALEATDFTLGISGGTATLSSTTPSSISISGNVYTLGLSLSGTPDGGETVTVVPSSATAIYDGSDNAASTTQSNNTVGLNDQAVPTITGTTVATDNSTIAVTFSEAVYNATGGSGALEATDFALGISGGTATLSSTTPSSISISGNVYTLGLSLSGTPDGGETVTVVPSSSTAIYDGSDNAASTTQSNNTVSLNDQTGPTMTITATEVNDGDTSNDATLSLTFTSNESTADFVVGDISVTNGALSSFAGSGTSYTATFTPTTDGATTIDVAGTTFTDASGNNNLAATQFNWTFDSTGPTVWSQTNSVHLN